MEAISSKQNPLCTHMRRLASTRSYREEKKEFFCDSPKLLGEALRWGAEIVAVLYTADVTLPALPATVRAAEVTEAVMKSVSPMEAPQGVALKTLAGHLKMTVPATSLLVETMVNKGFFERTPNPEDRRAVCIRLSEKGQEICNDVQARMLQEIDRVAGDIPTEELEAILQVANKLEAKVYNEKK